ncbi:farnesyltransferase, CAAX box, beta [Chytriomyces cf. hyalinus JEL632]|nr:farnesyltransferase, CAAX box, beta [Chytriomyces cf. hyalinus JEL632]
MGGIGWGLKDDNQTTSTSELQAETEESIFALLANHQTEESSRSLFLTRTAHVRFLKSAFKGLGRGFVSLDASKPWILFWIIHALDLLEEPLLTEERERAIDTLSRCQNDTSGGFGGGAGQLSHLATTYAAVHALAAIGTAEAFDSIVNRKKLYNWILSLKQPNGSFIMHYGGEVDVRGSYCVASVCKLLNMLTPEITENMGAFIASCQSYEGGMGSFPGVEAHGGYTFCAMAAMEILQETNRLDARALTEWTVSRQMELEGGFHGRTNKLVDGCYSFWVGGIFPILDAMSLRKDGSPAWSKTAAPFNGILNRDALQEYILICCQAPKGGLRDKPDKSVCRSPDFYHTCYCLSGLSIAQHTYSWSTETLEFSVVENTARVVGVANNKLPATHPVHNIRMDRVLFMQAYFQRQVE